MVRLIFLKTIINFIAKFADFYKIDLTRVSLGLQGGHGRGQAFEDSDVDLVIAFPEEFENDYPRGAYFFEGRDVDVRHLYLFKTDAKSITPKIRYVYNRETIILSDPSKAFSEFISHTGLDDNECEDIIVKNVRAIAKLGAVYKNMEGGVWRNFQWENNADYWIKKNDVLTAHIRLNEITSHIAEIIFALNKLCMPSLKWRYHILQELNWLPEDFKNQMEQFTLIQNFSEEDYWRRQKAAVILLTECIDEAINQKIFPEDFNAAYNKTTKRYIDE